MSTLASTQHEPQLAKPVAPEDLARGDMVAVLNEIVEYPSYFWYLSDPQILPPVEPVRIQWRSRERGLPLVVLDICLPFIFVKQPNGKYRTMDVRVCQLVRLNRVYARRVRKRLRKRKNKKKSRCQS